MQDQWNNRCVEAAFVKWNLQFAEFVRNPFALPSIPSLVNDEWRWGHAGESTSHYNGNELGDPSDNSWTSYSSHDYTSYNRGATRDQNTGHYRNAIKYYGDFPILASAYHWDGIHISVDEHGCDRCDPMWGCFTHPDPFGKRSDNPQGSELGAPTWRLNTDDLVIAGIKESGQCV
ncbi:UNVERIFIED_CONTAM: hypothetical protein K2H54_056550 [Gekko kuhli]